MKARVSSGQAVWRLVTAACIAIMGCACSNDATLTELHRLKSGTLDIVLLSSRGGLHHGKDSFIIEFRSADGTLVDVGDVRGSATMSMPGMPMLGAVDVKRTNVDGRYSADSQLEMAGTWRMTIEWRGSPGQGSVTFAGAVQ